MGYQIPNRPTFLERALQGLAFWIGHRHSLFRAYPLPEGAMVAEACNLIQANLSESLKLLPEFQYKALLPRGHRTLELGARARADLAIVSNDGYSFGVGAGGSDGVHYVLEVKRGSASKASINEDLRRLHAFLCASAGGVRAFLVVVSESKDPARFVNDGKSRLGAHGIPNSTGIFHVRRTVKAAASFARKHSAHYVCLIEVFCDRPARLPPI